MTDRYRRMIHPETRETPAEYSYPYECAVCDEEFDAETLRGPCSHGCGAMICDQHERATVETPDKQLHCPECAKKAGLMNCSDCDALFAKTDLVYDAEFDLWECVPCFQKSLAREQRWAQSNQRNAA